jgi:galactokinase
VEAEGIDTVTAAVTERFAREDQPPPRHFTVVPSAGARRLT